MPKVIQRSHLDLLAISAIAIGLLSACGGSGSQSSSPTSVSPAPTPSPSPTPTPTPTTLQTAQFPAPFGLTASSPLDGLGWQSSGSSLVPATDIAMRWNAQINDYEVKLPGEQFGRLMGSANPYRIANSDGSLQSRSISLNFAPHSVEGAGPSLETPKYTFFTNSSNSDLMVFGIATPAGSLPSAGSQTCKYNVDDNGDGSLTIDWASRSVTGSLNEFYGNPYPLPVTMIAANASRFSALGPRGQIDAQFFGPAAQELVVRWQSTAFFKLWIMLCTSA